MKKIILPLIILTLMSMAFADVAVQIVTPTAVASDVPFPVQVKLNTNGEQTNIVQLTFVGIALANPVFSGASKCGSCLPAGNLDVTTGTLGNGKNFLALLAPVDVDTPFSSTALTTFFTFNAKVVLADLNIPVTESIHLSEEGPAKSSTDNFVAGSGGNIQLSPDYSQAEYTVNPSTCGDGIVGYVDSTIDGTYDPTSEAQEACDVALAAAGCSSDCTYIKASHKIQGSTSLALQPQCSFGARSCPLEQLTGLSKFLAKINAIFASSYPSCFPYAAHPQAQSGFTGDKDGAFCVTAKGIVQQIPPLRKALLEYYAEP